VLPGIFAEAVSQVSHEIQAALGPAAGLVEDGKVKKQRFTK